MCIPGRQVLDLFLLGINYGSCSSHLICFVNETWMYISTNTHHFHTHFSADPGIADRHHHMSIPKFLLTTLTGSKPDRCLTAAVSFLSFKVSPHVHLTSSMTGHFQFLPLIPGMICLSTSRWHPLYQSSEDFESYLFLLSFLLLLIL